ncbi:hypothetical protein [Chryseolinea lacunae]|uniref:VCBS repeat-containing protein n=1 Tax=Chryseolinea lacunae TaxID=2801331 RepID=A0ABS1KWV8_9BACT|nr:hypothetical protein [Chryseolinea lacunae]MBL0743697.1 hypothetical protein [Chryseolinea lacunae]
MKPIFFVALFVLLSCSNRKPLTAVIEKVDTPERESVDSARKSTVVLEEFFADSLTIGMKSHNKIELSKYRSADSCYVIIHFYSRKNGMWTLKNAFEFSKDGIVGLDTELSDFNNDGLNDLTYRSAVAARGANEVRRLFIYDKAKDDLVLMKNSDAYPNLLYNETLHCIDAFLVYGGSSTVFLKISGDSLREFASVDLFEGLTVSTIDWDGTRNVIRRDTANKEGYVRYKNYKPLQVRDTF